MADNRCIEGALKRLKIHDRRSHPGEYKDEDAEDAVIRGAYYGRKMHRIWW